MFRKFALSLFGMYALVTLSIYASEGYYAVIESKGINSVGLLGENIRNVEKMWGKAERLADDDFPYSPYRYYEYHKKGALFKTDKSGKILGITVYSNTGDKEKFHKTGLMWINPSSIYDTFQGTTSRGLKFKDKMIAEDVYSIYGKPEASIQLEAGVDVKSKLREGKPLIVEMGKAGFTIYYPALGISFEVFNGMVESCTISEINSER